jgi:hypothetical protein
MHIALEHLKRAAGQAGPISRAYLPQRCRTIGMLALALLVLTVMLPSANAQRAVIIVDGEQVQIEFDEVEVLRQQIERHLRNQPGNLQAPPMQLAPEFDVSLPDDAELSRVTIDPDLLAMVAELNSEQYEMREQATATLLDAPHENIQFYAILARQELTTEQRSRLLMIVRQRLLHAPRGAVGISMIPHRAPDGSVHIEVDRLIDGLPAERLLRVGDRITRLEGQPLQAPDQLTVKVQSRRPGDQITLDVLRPRRDEHGRLLRDGERVVYDELKIELTLGSADLLDEAGAPRGAQRSAVQQIRRQKSRLIMERFAPQSITIDIDSTLLSLNPLDDPDQHIQRIIDRHVEEHPAIMQIREHRRMLEENSMDPPDILRAQWRETEARLQSQLQYANLTAEQRMILQSVLNRFRELTIE